MKYCFLFILFLVHYQKVEAQKKGMQQLSYYIDEDRKLHIKTNIEASKKIELKGPDFVSQSNYQLSKDSLGHWNVVLPPMPIGFHYIWLEVDGQKVLLPNAETYFGYNQEVNGFEVDSHEDFFTPKTDKKGRLEKIQIRESKLNPSYLYKPFNFSSKKKYPLLILVHGAGENSSGWVKQGMLQNILDNLIVEKKIKPHLVLMINGDVPNVKNYGNLEEETLDELPLIEQDLMQIILPRIERKYSISKYSIAGLSKGSFQTLTIATNNSEKFKKVGLFSPVLYSGVVEDSFAKIKTENFNNQTYFLGVGTLESERFQNFKQLLEEEFTKRKVHFKSYESPETYHEWLTWRRCLYEFLLWKP